MLEHHRGGLHMAEFVLAHRADGPVHDLAQRIVFSQNKEIGEMQRAQEQLGGAERPTGEDDPVPRPDREAPRRPPVRLRVGVAREALQRVGAPASKLDPAHLHPRGCDQISQCPRAECEQAFVGRKGGPSIVLTWSSVRRTRF